MIVEPAAGRRFEASVPVLIAGGGAAGLAAALAVSDEGVDCFVLEKSHACLGSSSMSLGALCAAGSLEQRRNGVEDGPDRFFDDIMAKTAGRADPVVARLVAEQSGPTLDWLAERHDVPFVLDTEWRPVFGHSAQRMHTVPERTGAAMMERLVAAADRAAADIVADAAVTAAFCDDADRVCGVRIARPDGSCEEIGCESLILATSGFGGNHEMIRQYIPEMSEALYFGWEGNQGEGILLGERLGGELGDMSSYQGLGLLADAFGLDVNPKLLIQGGIQVNADGCRFSNELHDVSGQGAVVIAQPGGYSWLIYDERIRSACSALPQLRELQAMGGEKRGESGAALAAMLALPEPSLRRTLDQWSAVARGELADPFGRPGGGAPLEPPYFAIRVTGALFHTQGGLSIDAEARVRRRDGSALPNLYAAGGTARGISGPGSSGYLPGAGLASAITLGRIAGMAAARGSASAP